jgi:hypothetical protein
MWEDIEIAGYKCRIWAEKTKGGFYGHWSCECGETAQSNHLDETEKMALAAAHYGKISCDGGDRAEQTKRER